MLRILFKIILMLLNLWAHLSYFLKDFSLYLGLITLAFFISIILSYKIFKSEVGLKRKKVLISAAYTIFLVFLIYSGFEAYFRYRYNESDGLGFLQVDKRWHARYDVFNNYFYRDRNFEPDKKEGVTRIGVMGDSITQGAGIKNPKNRFSDILERKLKDSGKNSEVYNLGRSGLDTVGEVEEYEKVRHLKFNILVWEYYINDVQPENSTGSSVLDKNSKRGQIVTFLSNKSFFFDYVYWRLSSRYQKTIQELRTADVAQYHNEPVLAKHKEDISNFIKSLKTDNTKIVVVFFPSLYLLSSDYPARDIHYMMIDYFKQNEVDATIDLLPDLIERDKKTLIASRFDTHPNEFVHDLAAQRIFEKVLPLLK